MSSATYKDVDLPADWEPIYYLCYPDNGSKAYKHPSGANAHVINMYDRGLYIAQLEDSSGAFHEKRLYDYDAAVNEITRMVAKYE